MRGRRIAPFLEPIGHAAPRQSGSCAGRQSAVPHKTVAVHTASHQPWKLNGR
jgi:hypothetical protein